MLRARPLPVAGAVLVSGLAATQAWGFGGLGPASMPVPATTPEPVAAENLLTAPVLVEHPAALYPTDAIAARLEGNVGLELAVDASGRVTDVRVTKPAGHGFDEAASAAARHFVFRPARRGDAPLASKVLFTYEFRLPTAPAVPSVPTVPTAPRPSPAPDSHMSTLVRASRPTSAASSFSVQDRDFRFARSPACRTSCA